jgi:hypothetical protein
VKSSGTRLACANALALLFVFAAEWALFSLGAGRHYAWTYPRWSDQLQYLQEAYASYDVMRARGFLAGARHALAILSPQGSLHGFLALCAFRVAGPTRNAALAVNLAAFLALQGSMFMAARRLSGSWWIAWASAGLLCALRAPWSGDPGSAFDFRLDWLGACAYGVALCAAVSAGGFRSTRGAVLFGAAVGVALLARDLTAAYFGLVYAGLLAWLLCGPERLARCARLALSGACALAVAGWAFWRSWHEIYSYYWIGHFVGAESALRGSHMGALASAVWLCSELLVHQVGISAVLLALAAGASLLAARVPAGEGEGPSPAPPPVSGAWPPVLVFLAAPAAVLLLHPEKAAQPLNIMAPALAWVIVLAWLRLARGAGPSAVAATCAAVACAGAALFAGAQMRSPYGAGMEAEYRGVNALSDFLYFRSEEAGLSQPRVAVNWMLDALGAEQFEILGRERHGRPLHFVATLPTGLFAADPGDVMKRLAGSDFVCLVTRAPENWPFDRQMAEMLPRALAWCEGNLKRDGELGTEQFSASIYERRDLGRPGTGGVDLAAMLAASSRGPADAAAVPPAAPLLSERGTILWTTQADLRYALRAAYSPVRFRADSLPAGLELDHGSGEIRGWFRMAGDFGADITAQNAVGSSAARIAFRVTGDAWGAEARAPAKALAGAPVEGRSISSTCPTSPRGRPSTGSLPPTAKKRSGRAPTGRRFGRPGRIPSCCDLCGSRRAGRGRIPTWTGDARSKWLPDPGGAPAGEVRQCMYYS